MPEARGPQATGPINVRGTFVGFPQKARKRPAAGESGLILLRLSTKSSLYPNTSIGYLPVALQPVS